MTDVQTAEEWARLAALIDDDADLAARVAEARDSDDDPWAVLIDGLDENGALAYLQEGDTGMELADALPAIPRVFHAAVDVDDVGDVDDLDSAIARADEILASHRLRLVYLEEDEDALPLVVVLRDLAEEIVSLAHDLGHAARIYPPR